MHRRQTIALSAVALALAAPVGARAQVPAAVTRAATTWKAVRTARGTFEQTVVNSLLGKSAVSNGGFLEERPGKLAIHFVGSDDEIVSDGKYVWVYLPSTLPGSVLRQAVADGSSTPVDFDQLLDSPETRYTITDRGATTLDGQPAHSVVLVPKSGARANFSKATVWINDADGLVHQVEAVESSTVTRRIHILTIQTNVTVDEASFKFSVPKGVKIIGG